MPLHVAWLGVEHPGKGLLNHPYLARTIGGLDGPIHTTVFSADPFEGRLIAWEQNEIDVERNTVDQDV